MLPAPAQERWRSSAEPAIRRSRRCWRSWTTPTVAQRSPPSEPCWPNWRPAVRRRWGAIAEVVESIDDDGRIFDELSLRACMAAADGSDVIRVSGIGTPARPQTGASGGRGVVRTRCTRGHVAFNSAIDAVERGEGDDRRR